RLGGGGVAVPGGVGRRAGGDVDRHVPVGRRGDVERVVRAAAGGAARLHGAGRHRHVGGVEARHALAEGGGERDRRQVRRAGGRGRDRRARGRAVGGDRLGGGGVPVPGRVLRDVGRDVHRHRPVGRRRDVERERLVVHLREVRQGAVR